MRRLLLLSFALLSFFVLKESEAQPRYDVEFAYFKSPGVHQSEEGEFSDAMYIMDASNLYFTFVLNNNGNTVYENIGKMKIYREDEYGIFTTEVFNEQIDACLTAYVQRIFINMDPYDYDERSFHPQSYLELNAQGANYHIPDRFKFMAKNVTPRYKVVIKLSPDKDTTNNYGELIFRLYLKKGIALVSAENTWQDIGKNSPKDIIAGKLNFDSLHTLCSDIENRVNKPLFDYFDRNSWEPQNVDYSKYKAIFWIDGDDKPVSKHERYNIAMFGYNGSWDDRLSVVIFSQEIARFHTGNVPDYDGGFMDFIGARNNPPGNPSGENINNDGNSIISMDNKYIIPIKSTQFPGDNAPHCGLIQPAPEMTGFVNEFMYYKNFNNTDSIAVLTNYIKGYHSIYFAVDFRHLANNEKIMQMIIDNITANVKNIFACLITDKDTNDYFPGETIEFELATENSIGFPLHGKKIVCKYNLSGVVDTVFTDDRGKGKYIFAVPEDALPGSYHVNFVYNSSESTTAIEVVTFNVLSTDIAYNGPGNVCEKETDSYQAEGEYRNFKWTALENCSINGSSNESFVEIKWKEAGPARIEFLQNITRINKISRDTIVKQVLPRPEKATISKAETLQALISSSPENNYWYFNGEYINNDHGDTIYVHYGGDYSVKVLGDNGCFSEADTFRLIISVDENKNKNDLTICPNPTNNFINLSYSDNFSGKEILIFDIYGNTRFEIKDIRLLKGNRIQTDSFPNGIYYLKVKTDSGIITRRFVVFR